MVLNMVLMKHFPVSALLSPVVLQIQAHPTASSVLPDLKWSWAAEVPEFPVHFVMASHFAVTVHSADSVTLAHSAGSAATVHFVVPAVPENYSVAALHSPDNHTVYSSSFRE